jgi:hypothetical protein
LITGFIGLAAGGLDLDFSESSLNT